MLYFAIYEVKCDCSAYGNDVDWSGIIVDDQNNIINQYFCIGTCEMATEPYDWICEMDEDGEIFDEEGEIIDQDKYEQAEEEVKSMIEESYLEMDDDCAEYIEIEGDRYTKISIGDFLARHQIGEVGHFVKETFEDSYETIESVEELEGMCHSHLCLSSWNTDILFETVQKVTKNEIINLASIIFDILEDEDCISKWCNISCGGDYSMESEGAAAVRKASVIIAFLILKVQSRFHERETIVSGIIRCCAINFGFEYNDAYDYAYDDTANSVCEAMDNKVKMYNEDIARSVDKLSQQGEFDKTPAELIELVKSMVRV